MCKSLLTYSSSFFLFFSSSLFCFLFLLSFFEGLGRGEGMRGRWRNYRNAI